MQAPAKLGNVSALQKGIVLGAILNVVLVGCGLALFPTTLSASPGGRLGIVAIVSLLVGYGLAGWFGPPITCRADARILRSAVVIGLAAGLVFTLEMLLEYFILPNDNTVMGIVEFGTVFFLYFAVAIRAAHQTERVRYGILSAVWSALIGSLIWLMALLTISYIFSGTPQQVQVFRAEGNYEDFLRSGMSDFQAFIMQDLLGAGFFHLLLGPIIAALLGLWGRIDRQTSYTSANGSLSRSLRCLLPYALPNNSALCEFPISLAWRFL